MTTETAGARRPRGVAIPATPDGTPPDRGVSAGRVLTAEWLKLRSLRSTWWLLLALVLGIVVVGTFTAVGIVVKDGVPASERVAADPTGGSVSGVGWAQLAAIALGVLAVTAEYRNGMIRASLTAVPRRSPLVFAKVAVVTGVTFSLSLCALLLTFVAARTVIARDGAPISLTTPGVVRAVIGGAVLLGLTAAWATGVGWLLRSTAGAIFTLVGLLYLLPALVGVLPGAVGDRVLPYLPSNAAAAVTAVHRPADALHPLVGLVVYAAYAVLTIAGAALLLQRRDV